MKLKLLLSSATVIMALASVTFLGSCAKDDGDDNNTTPTCTDGIKNGTELAVDCGGSCSACICDVGYEGDDCSTRVLNKYKGTYLVSGTSTFSGTVDSLKNVSITIDSSGNGAAFIYMDLYMPDYVHLTGQFTNNTGSFNINSQFYNQNSYHGNGTFSGTTIWLTMDKTQVSKTRTIVLSGNKQ